MKATYNTSKIMKQAHKLARSSRQKVSYRAKLSAALRWLYNAARSIDHQITILRQRLSAVRSDLRNRRLSNDQKLKSLSIFNYDKRLIKSLVGENFSTLIK